MYSQSTAYIFLSELHEACKSIKLYTYIGSYTKFCIAGLQDSSPEEIKMHQFFAASASPRTTLGKLAAHAQTHQLVGRGGKPLSKNPGPLAQPFGLRVSVLWVLPRSRASPRSVDFAPTPLLSSGTLWVYGCKPLVGQISWLNAGVAELLLSVIHVTHTYHVHEVTAVALHVQYSIFFHHENQSQP